MRRFRKTVSVGADVTSDGRLFQRRHPATGNARSPTVDKRVRRIASCMDDDDRRRQYQLPRSALKISNYSATPSSCVHVLGICVDSEASMRIHVSRLVSTCFTVLRQSRSISLCRSVFQQILQSLVVSLISSRVDHGNAPLTGLLQSAHQLIGRIIVLLKLIIQNSMIAL